MKVQRINSIRDYTYQKGTVSLQELAKKYDVSLNTIRRDVNQLEKQGEIEKVYGGIKSKPLKLEVFDNRNIQHIKEKQEIGYLASRLIEDCDIIYIDSGTTTLQILKHLNKDIKLTVLTNSLDVLNECILFENIKIYLVGSYYQKTTRSFVELDRHINLKDFNISKSFMAATGFSASSGLTNSDPFEYETKKNVVEISNKIYPLIDSSKIGVSAMLTYCTPDKIDAIITDAKVPLEYREYCMEQNIQLITE